MKVIEYELSVQWGDTDAAGIVFYPNFYKWMDQASHHFFAKIGFSSSRLMSEDKIGLPLLETSCKFHKPLVFENQFVIKTSIDEIKNKVFRFHHNFYKEGSLVAEGIELRAWTSFSGERPKAVEIPAHIREQMTNWSDR